MFSLVRHELGDNGQTRTFTLAQADSKDELRTEWESILDKVGLEIIEQ